MKKTIVYIDSINATIQYNFSLLSLLNAAGFDMRFYTSTFLWEQDFPDPPNTTTFFFRRSARLCRAFGLGRKFRQILRGMEYPVDALHMRREIARIKPAAVHFNFCPLPSVDLRLMRSIRKMQIPLYYTAHDFLPHDTGDKHLAEFARIYRFCDRIIVLTDYVKKQIVERVGIAPDKIFIIPHPDYAPVAAAVGENIMPGKPEEYRRNEVMFYGQIHHYKGLDLLLKAFRIVQERHAQASLRIVGNANHDMKRYFMLMEELGLDKQRVSFDTRFLTMKESIQLIKRTGLMVLPYKRSSQSGVIPLASTLGIPVITTSVGGLPEMVLEGGNGFVVPPENSTALAETMLFALQELARENRLTVSTVAAGEMLFGGGNIVNAFNALYVQ